MRREAEDRRAGQGDGDAAKARLRSRESLKGLHFCPRSKKRLLKGFKVEKCNDGSPF